MFGRACRLHAATNVKAENQTQLTRTGKAHYHYVSDAGRVTSASNSRSQLCFSLNPRGRSISPIPAPLLPRMRWRRRGTSELASAYAGEFLMHTL